MFVCAEIRIMKYCNYFQNYIMKNQYDLLYFSFNHITSNCTETEVKFRASGSS